MQSPLTGSVPTSRADWRGREHSALFSGEACRLLVLVGFLLQLEHPLHARHQHVVRHAAVDALANGDLELLGPVIARARVLARLIHAVRQAAALRLHLPRRRYL